MKAATNVIQMEQPQAIEVPKPQPKLYWKPILQTFTICGIVAALWIGGIWFVTQRIALTTEAKIQAMGSEVQGLDRGLGAVKEALDVRHDIDALYFKIIHLKPTIDYQFAHRLATLIYREAQAQAVDPNFVIALIRIESNFKPNAKSPTGATGLTQIMPFWKTALPIPGELDDPAISIRYGIQIFRSYEKMYNGNTFLALAAYNQGPDTVNATIRRGADPRENNTYTADIQKIYAKLKWLDRGREGLGE